MVKTRRAALLSLAILLAFVAPRFAQASESGTLIVKTTDKTGPFPGIVVEIKNNKNLIETQTKTTDASGTASFVLPAGSGYTIRVSGGGMSEQQSEEFKIDLDKTKTVLFTMSSQIVEKVVVKEKLVDLDKGAEKTTTFSDNFIEDLPIAGRSYQNVLTLAPGVQDTNGDGNPNVHGSRERDFKATIDGVSNVDPLTGTFMSNINPDAIEDIEIVTTGASAEYGGRDRRLRQDHHEAGLEHLQRNVQLLSSQLLFRREHDQHRHGRRGGLLPRRLPERRLQRPRDQGQAVLRPEPRVQRPGQPHQPRRRQQRRRREEGHPQPRQADLPGLGAQQVHLSVLLRPAAHRAPSEWMR
jgi:hypothetical protein